MTELAAGRVITQHTVQSADTLVLDSDLASMAHLPGWVDAVGARHAIPEKTLFAAKLCLEEAVSNSIRHGYKAVGGKQVRVAVSTTETGWAFTVEDDAPPFDPLHHPDMPAISLEPLIVGGQGIRLLKAFATSLVYTEIATGNRLQIAFAAPTPGSSVGLQPSE